MFNLLQIQILKLLCLYKQLTIPQLVRVVEGDHSTQKIRRHLNQLYSRKRPLVQRVEYDKISHFGRLSYVYSITKLGVSLLEQHQKIKITDHLFTPSRPKLTDDYFHRMTTIDFHIYLRSRAKEEKFEVRWCTEYFVVKKVLNSFVSINKLSGLKSKDIIPDLVICLEIDSKKRFLLFELHNGKDKKRIKEQIREHALLLVSLHCHTKYGINPQRFYYVLILFEKRSVFNAVIEDIANDHWYANVAQFFLCKHKNQSTDSFLSGWTNLLGEPSTIIF